jgi:hypothetical protein
MGANPTDIVILMFFFSRFILGFCHLQRAARLGEAPTAGYSGLRMTAFGGTES